LGVEGNIFRQVLAGPNMCQAKFGKVKYLLNGVGSSAKTSSFFSTAFLTMRSYLFFIFTVFTFRKWHNWNICLSSLQCMSKLFVLRVLKARGHHYMYLDKNENATDWPYFN
jgi:hypothetical protein